MSRGGRFDFGGLMIMLAMLAVLSALALSWVWGELGRGPRISQPAAQTEVR